MQSATKTKIEIARDINVADLVENYPMVVDFLFDEYGFHCVSRFFSAYDTLEQGARIHGIEGEDFEDMLTALNDLVSLEAELQ